MPMCLAPLTSRIGMGFISEGCHNVLKEVGLLMAGVSYGRLIVSSISKTLEEHCSNVVS